MATANNNTPGGLTAGKLPLDKLKGRGAGSETGTRSQISKGTIRTGTRSRKSRFEVDYASMSVLEIEGHIE